MLSGQGFSSLMPPMWHCAVRRKGGRDEKVPENGGLTRVLFGRYDRIRPVADDPPRNGEGDHRRWWRGTGGAGLRIKDRKHLACPSTMLRMVQIGRGSCRERVFQDV